MHLLLLLYVQGKGAGKEIQIHDFVMCELIALIDLKPHPMERSK